VYCLADHPAIAAHSVLDERAAGFVALGIAKASGRPAIVACTSGTAAANLLPAVVEASEAGVPLIVLTADRPPELRDVGAGQTIDQIKLFGSFARWFCEVGSMPLDEAALVHHRALACRTVAEATGRRRGPVHLNLSLRDPLHPQAADLTALAATDGAVGRTGNAPWTVSRQPPAGGDAELATALAAAKRPLIVAGEPSDPAAAEAIAANARRLGVPVLTDALSGLRTGVHASRATVVAAYEAILREPRVTDRLTPDFVLRVGDMPTSKTLRQWLAGLGARQAVLDPLAHWREPTRHADVVSTADPVATLELAGERAPSAQPAWREQFALLEETTQAAIDGLLAQEAFPNEPAIARAIAPALPAGATVWLSSSMPVRDAEWFAPCGDAGVRYLANRGANGIDGVVASAVGAALAASDPVVLLVGDVALLHDVGSLGLARERQNLTIVCVNNDGGGIFEFLPIADCEPHFEPLIATPTGVDFAALARGFDIDASEPRDVAELTAALTRPGLVQLRTQRDANRELHTRIWERSARTLCELVDVGALAG
jgi:2-succinyl-5-enolpyruvyl-6-hydroxy-3-cyclohexene-1-carboxylate synthase